MRVRPSVCPLALLVLICGCTPDQTPVDVPAVAPAYVDDATCASCHQQQTGDWTGSHHDLAMQEASPQTVLGDFDSTFTHFGVTSRFSRDGDRYLVNTEGPDGELSDFEIAYTFGVEPLQQYLIGFPDGRLQVLGIAWDTVREQWFHLYPEERIPPDDPLHWTGPYQNWNYMCAECHSTDLQKNYDLETRTYATSWKAIDVGCQACHGPGERHLEWARRAGPVAVGSRSAEELGLVVDFRNGSAVDQIQSCAVCHSRRRQISTNDIAGENFLDHFVPEILREDLYHTDGQIMEEVYVYGSFLQSRMYRGGVSCTDCHNAHSLSLRATGNDLCEQCHQPRGPAARFPTLTLKAYDSPEHHFHATDSPGAQCVNCHMPERTYMVVDPRRDHSFRIPRPDLSVRLGTPNACNDCHTDQTPEWAANAVSERYGADRLEEPHYAETLAAGRNGEPDAAADLSELALDREATAIVRATALELLTRYGAQALPALTAAVADPEPLLRITAAGALEPYPPEERLRRLPPLLRDPLRSVRLEAARVLALGPTNRMPIDDRALLADLIGEYEAVQVSLGDMAPAHLNLGVLHAATGSPQQAVEDYQTALELQPDFTPASLNLARLFSEIGRNGEAFLVLRDALAEHPNEGEVHYSMGLLLAEMGQMEEATETLGTAADLLPEHSRARYNYGLALQQLGRRDEAEATLMEAHALDPADPSIVRALAVFYSQDGRWTEALEWGEALIDLLPGNAGARQFLEALRRDSQP